jgi:hypothetical protein
MLYEKLNAEMKKTVDAWVGRLRVLDWSRRSTLLTDAALPFGQDLPPDKARTATRGFITAVLERLGAPEVADPHQAVLYLASLDPDHRARAERWLDEHPEFRAVAGEETDTAEEPAG